VERDEDETMLTTKQHELLNFIHHRLGQSGISPSFDEMRHQPPHRRDCASRQTT